MAALQVHHHRRQPQYPPQQVTFSLDERGAGYRLRQEITVLTDVLVGCRLPGHPVRLRRGIHQARLLPVPQRVKRLSSRWPPAQTHPSCSRHALTCLQQDIPEPIQQSQFVFPDHGKYVPMQLQSTVQTITTHFAQRLYDNTRCLLPALLKQQGSPCTTVTSVRSGTCRPPCGSRPG